MAIQKVTSSLIADNAVGLDQLNVTDGTDGQVLKTNGSGTLSFADAAGGGGGVWNVISSQTVSSTTSTVSFTGVTGYKHYKLIFSSVNHSGSNSVMGVRFSTDNGSNWTSSITFKSISIRYRSAGNESDAPTVRKNFSGSGMLPLASSFNEYNNDQKQQGEVSIWGLNESEWTMTHSRMLNNEGWSPHGLEMNETYARIETNTAYNAIQIGSTSYNFDAGTFTLYGIANS